MPDYDYRRGNELGYGEATQLDEAADVASGGPDVPLDEATQPEGQPAPGVYYGNDDDIGDEYDAVLFSPTDQPNVPGDTPWSGPNTPLSDQARLFGIAEQIITRRGEMPDEAVLWALRVAAGEA